MLHYKYGFYDNFIFTVPSSINAANISKRTNCYTK